MPITQQISEKIAENDDMFSKLFGMVDLNGDQSIDATEFAQFLGQVLAPSTVRLTSVAAARAASRAKSLVEAVSPTAAVARSLAAFSVSGKSGE